LGLDNAWRVQADRPWGRGRNALDAASGGGSSHASRRWAWTAAAPGSWRTR